MLEAEGIATVCLSMVPDFTAAAGAPRIAAIEHPCGVPLGKPGDRAGQTAVLRAALDVLHNATTPGQVVHLPFTWPDPPRASRFEPPEARPGTRSARQSTVTASRPAGYVPCATVLTRPASSFTTGLPGPHRSRSLHRSRALASACGGGRGR